MPKRTMPKRGGPPPLKFKDYERINPYRKDEDEEEFEDPDLDEWVDYWEDAFPDLDGLDDIDDFLEDIEERDDDKYKEPS